MMKPQIAIPKELLAQFDLANTLNGGIANLSAKVWQDQEGIHLMLRSPGMDWDSVRIEAVNQRFVVYYNMEVLGGEMQLPCYLMNVPLLPIVDVNRITARQEDGHIHIFAPYNDWAKGVRKEIALEE